MSTRVSQCEKENSAASLSRFLERVHLDSDDSVINHQTDSAGADLTAITARCYSHRRGLGTAASAWNKGGRGREIKALLKRMLNTSPLGLDLHVLYA